MLNWSSATKWFSCIKTCINLTFLEQWLEKQLRIVFNPLANILSAVIKQQQTKWKAGKTTSKQHHGLSKLLNAISGAAARDDKRHCKTFPNEKITCSVCENNH